MSTTDTAEAPSSDPTVDASTLMPDDPVLAQTTASIRFGYAWLDATYSNHAGLEATFDQWLADYTRHVTARAFTTAAGTPTPQGPHQ